MKRPSGTGSIDALPDGTFRPRLPKALGRTVLGIFDNARDAETALAIAIKKVVDGEQVGADGKTLASFGPLVFVHREKVRHLRSVDTDRSRFNAWLRDSFFAHWHLSTIQPEHVRRFRDDLTLAFEKSKWLAGRKRRRISHKNVRRILSLLSSIFEHAIEMRVVKTNPVVGVRVFVPPETTTEETWTYLNRDEQQAEFDARNWWVVFSFATGLRHGEFRMLELRDLYVDGSKPRVFVRYGGIRLGKKLPPKGGKPRTVPLFGAGLIAARAWLAQLPTYCPNNPLELVFPTARGSRYGRSKHPEGWNANLKRRVRWHDLRHTCASSLVSGMWGKAWSLEDVRGYLGHTDIKTTQNYAHLAGTALESAAEETDEMAAWYTRVNPPDGTPQPPPPPPAPPPPPPPAGPLQAAADPSYQRIGTETLKMVPFPKNAGISPGLWLQLSRVQSPSVTPPESFSNSAAESTDSYQGKYQPRALAALRAITKGDPCWHRLTVSLLAELAGVEAPAEGEEEAS